MRTQHATTLIELLIAITIISILATITISGLNHFTRHGRSQAVLMRVRHLIEQAHEEAQVLSKPVSFTLHHPLADALTFVDLARNGELADKHLIIARSKIKRYGGVLMQHSFPVSRNYISFMPSRDGVNDSGIVWYCGKNNNKPDWALKINQQGIIQAIYPKRNGNIRDPQGRVLHC